MFEGDNSTNLAIEKTASSEEATNFFYYNNGVTIICDAATYNPFNKILEMKRPQIVNGGQTVRIMHKCLIAKKLRTETAVAVRVTTTGGNKDFASNVAINLNNQTRVNNAFLRSNDPRILQLYHSLASIGWHLERRDGEIEALTASERSDLEAKFGSPLSDHIVPLKEGMQAFVATVYGDPQLAKKDPNKIFSDQDGGQFSKILDFGLTADSFLLAYQLFKSVGIYIDDFKKLKRRRNPVEKDREGAYATFFGQPLVTYHFKDLDSAVPQATVFLSGLMYERYINVEGEEFRDLVGWLTGSQKASILNELLQDLLESETSKPSGKSWPTLLKSGTFFNGACEYTHKKHPRKKNVN